MLLAVVSLVTALMAVVSLLSDHSILRNLRSGKADYADLADYTGEFNRDRLQQLPGIFIDSHNEFRVDPGFVARLPRSRLFYWEIVGDLVSLVLCVAAASINLGVANSQIAWLAVLPAVAYEAASWGRAILKTVRNIDLLTR